MEIWKDTGNSMKDLEAQQKIRLQMVTLVLLVVHRTQRKIPLPIIPVELEVILYPLPIKLQMDITAVIWIMLPHHR